MRRADELDFGEHVHQIADDSPLPLGVQVKVKLVNQYDARRFYQSSFTKMWVERRATNRHVGHHRHHVAVAVAQVAERKRAAGQVDYELVALNIKVHASRPWHAR